MAATVEVILSRGPLARARVLALRFVSVARTVGREKSKLKASEAVETRSGREKDVSTVLGALSTLVGAPGGGSGDAIPRWPWDAQLSRWDWS